jgi:hypothetical protein
MQCFTWLLLLVAAVLFMVSLLRWFEQVTEAVERGWWNKVFVLLAAPFMVWFYPSKVAAGRPSAVPRHEPVRGFGSVPLTPTARPQQTQSTSTPTAAPPTTAPSDGPPPGTPKEFIGLPKVPPKKKPAAIDPEKLAKLKQKMKEQGMLGDEE